MTMKRTKFLAEITDKKGKQYTVSFRALAHTQSLEQELFLMLKVIGFRR